MKKILLYFFLTLLGLSSFGQENSLGISIAPRESLYLRCPVGVKLTYPKESQVTYKISGVSNNIREHWKDSTIINIGPVDSIVKITLYLMSKNSDDYLDSLTKTYKVLNLPTPEIAFSSNVKEVEYPEENKYTEEFHKIKRPVVKKFTKNGWNIKYGILSYSVKITRQGKTVKLLEVKNPRKDIQKFLSYAQKGDEILFFNMEVSMPGQRIFLTKTLVVKN